MFIEYNKIIIEMPFFMLHEIVKAYPDAKFLLTEREPGKWATSFFNTVGVAHDRLKMFPISLFKYFDTNVMWLDRFSGQAVDYCTNGFGVSGNGREMLIENYKS
jgi:hypothetical protein